MSFVHLRVQTEFSLLDGAIKVKKLATAAKEAGFNSVAITDVANLFGAVEHSKRCKEVGIKPIFGASLHVQPQGLDHRPDSGFDGYKILALVRDRQGYQNLCELLTKAHHLKPHFRHRVDLLSLAQHKHGLFFVADWFWGPTGNQIASLAEAVDGNLFLELCEHGLPGEAAKKDAVSTAAFDLGLETVVTNYTCYLKPIDVVTYTALRALGNKARLEDNPWGEIANPRFETDQMYLKTAAEMEELHGKDPCWWAGNIAGMCEFDFEKRYAFPGVPLPSPTEKTEDNWKTLIDFFPPPKSWGLTDPTPEATDLVGYFRWYATTGLNLRLAKMGFSKAKLDTYLARLESELNMIEEMGFAGYMLVVAEFINWSKDHGIAVGPGRGSVAGSVVAWGMGITEIDPIFYGCLFERFLNPARVSMPDIDVDFEQARRDEVIEHVRQKYGKDRVSQIVTYGSLKARAAVQAAGKILGWFDGDCREISDMISDRQQPPMTIGSALNEVKALKRMYAFDPRARRLLDLAEHLEGFPRQVGVHAGGVIIGDRPLVESIPVMVTDGEMVSGYDMNGVEEIGLIKFDFLGLKTLDQIKDCIHLIEAKGEALPSPLPLTDTKAYELLRQGHSKGVFQLDSGGMRQTMIAMRPDRIQDIVALVALYRPGPLEAGMADDYIERKRGIRPIDFYHPPLEPILKDTFGTMVFQEQILRVAQVMAGYSLGEADLLRRAIGKKKADEMAAQRERFVSGSKMKGYTEAQANSMFDLIDKYAGYSFNIAHSAAYGYLSYVTAWLKANYRTEFTASLLSQEAADGKMDNVPDYANDARRAGIRLLPPCVNHSNERHTVEGHLTVRTGLAAVKGVGKAAAKIIEAREELGGSFQSLPQMIMESRADKKVLDALAKAGALDCFEIPRDSILNGVKEFIAVRTKVRTPRKKEIAAYVATHDSVSFGSHAAKFPATRGVSFGQRLEMEREVIGTHVSAHPLDEFATLIDKLNLHTIKQALAEGKEAEVDFAVCVERVREIKTKKGQPMAFAQLGDLTGAIEGVIFTEPWRDYKGFLITDEPLRVTGRLQQRGEAMNLIVNKVRSLQGEQAAAAKLVRLHLRAEEITDEYRAAIGELLNRFGGPKPIEASLLDASGETSIRPMPKYKVNPTIEFARAFQKLFGRRGVVEFVV